ncbi:MAG: hypothetical protein JKY89_08870 [Immundisolibacteraceae bacterium]|nr:hypothetical protein [Immundisolibacteraceae bacterium]
MSKCPAANSLCNTPVFRAISLGILLTTPVLIAAVSDKPSLGSDVLTLPTTKLIDVADGQLSVTAQASPSTDSIQQQKIISWLTSAADSIATIYGRFPVKHVAVNVIPMVRSGGEKGPVSFGMVERDPATRVKFFIDPDQPLQSFITDWTAVHEFAHLMLPYINREAAWLSEGIATYYQYVARVRANVISESQAFAGLIAGFERGRQNTDGLTSLRQDSLTMRQQKNYMRVYWSGVVFAMTVDMQLRQGSNNQQSLDSALLDFHHCCLPTQGPWSAVKFLSRLDQLTETALFSQNYHYYADRQDFPSVTHILENLGISTDSGIICIDDQAPLAYVRQAIMTTTAPSN